MSRHEENVHESVKLILQTYRGERVMQPEFGAVVGNVQFTTLSSEVMTGMEEDVQEALEVNEPRVTDVSVKTLREDRGELNVEISYRVRTTNNLFNRVYPFYVLEGVGAGADT